MRDRGQEPFMDYENEYDEKVESQMAERRRIRREKAKHREAIDKCNKLIMFEVVTLVVLVIALIVMLVK